MKSLIFLGLLLGATELHAAFSCADLFGSQNNVVQKSIKQVEAEAFLMLAAKTHSTSERVLGKKIIDENTVLIVRDKDRSFNGNVTTFEIWKRENNEFTLSNVEGGVQIKGSEPITKYELSENKKVLISISQSSDSLSRNKNQSVNVKIALLNGGRIESIDVSKSGIKNVDQIKKISVSEKGNATIEAIINGETKIVNHKFDISKLKIKPAPNGAIEAANTLSSVSYDSSYGPNWTPGNKIDVRTIDKNTVLVINRGLVKTTAKSVGGFTTFSVLKNKDGELNPPQDILRIKEFIPKFELSENNKLVALATTYFPNSGSKIGIKIDITSLDGGVWESFIFGVESNIQAEQIKNIHLHEDGTIEIDVIINGYLKVFKEKFDAKKLI